MEAIKNEDGSISITCHEQIVMTIDEVSDRDCINLFLIPINGDIIETPYMKDEDIQPNWTHELIANRTEQSKKCFKLNEPMYKLL